MEIYADECDFMYRYANNGTAEPGHCYLALSMSPILPPTLSATSR